MSLCAFGVLGVDQHRHALLEGELVIAFALELFAQGAREAEQMLHKELRRKGVTLRLLWQEYRAEQSAALLASRVTHAEK